MNGKSRLLHVIVQKSHLVHVLFKKSAQVHVDFEEFDLSPTVSASHDLMSAWGVYIVWDDFAWRRIQG